jgi:phosphoadenosine phosphosulfate reductase
MHDIKAFNREHQTSHPKETLEHIYEEFKQLTLSFSGAEDIILIDMACKLGLKPSVFTLDTGRLHPQTYKFIQTVMDHYAINIQLLNPDASQLQQLTNEKGLFSFYQDGHSECCGIRKVEPLKKHLLGYSGWITGQRKDQNLSTRGEILIAVVDNNFKGTSSTLYKFNPLCHWTSEQVWTYIRALEIPYNPLHKIGFSSIGCEPCTRAILPHQDPRDGRWWWEEDVQKECGLHKSN